MNKFLAILEKTGVVVLIAALILGFTVEVYQAIVGSAF